MDLVTMWVEMGIPVKSLMIILAFMSMWSVGVFFERLFTFTNAGKQSKAFAPQAAKHLKDGRLKDAIAVSQSKNYKYSHLGKVVLAGLQEYQFQSESGVQLGRDDVIDAVRRAIQRASALTTGSRFGPARSDAGSSARWARESDGAASTDASRKSLRNARVVSNAPKSQEHRWKSSDDSSWRLTRSWIARRCGSSAAAASTQPLSLQSTPKNTVRSRASMPVTKSMIPGKAAASLSQNVAYDVKTTF